MSRCNVANTTFRQTLQKVAWFAQQKASRICVNVDPANTAARRFYTRHGAEPLHEYWLVWNDLSIVLGER
jgi:D-serine deaminase-like pyridoxal phosphate-dependent protein